MTKKELKEKMQQTGAINNANASIWNEAFEMYEKETGQKLSRTCSKCYQKVKKWLKSK